MTNSEITGQKFAKWIKENPSKGKIVKYLLASILFAFIGLICWYFFESVTKRINDGKIAGTVALLLIIGLRVRSMHKKQNSLNN